MTVSIGHAAAFLSERRTFVVRRESLLRMFRAGAADAFSATGGQYHLTSPSGIGVACSPVAVAHEFRDGSCTLFTGFYPVSAPPSYAWPDTLEHEIRKKIREFDSVMELWRFCIHACTDRQTLEVLAAGEYMAEVDHNRHIVQRAMRDIIRDMSNLAERRIPHLIYADFMEGFLAQWDDEPTATEDHPIFIKCR